MIELAPTEVPLPPLMAKLEALPKAPAAQPNKKRPRKVARPKPPEPVPQPVAEPVSEPVSEPVAKSAPEAAASEVPPAPVIAEPAKDAPPLHPLPKKAQLAYAVYKGTNFRVGDARLRFEMDAEHNYKARVEANTSGIVSLFKKYDLTWRSHGTLDARGLHPVQYDDVRATGSGQETRSANFNRVEKMLEFSAGNRVALPEDAQDRVSFMLQMTQLPWDSGSVVLDLCDGRRLDHYEIDIGAEESVTTNMGDLRTLPFRKRHAANEPALDIWLAAEYRWLPVKIRQTDSNGNIEFEMVVSEIRLTDE